MKEGSASLPDTRNHWLTAGVPMGLRTGWRGGVPGGDPGMLGTRSAPPPCSWYNLVAVGRGRYHVRKRR